MSSAGKIKVGDIVIITGRSAPRRDVVTKVGRKFFYVGARSFFLDTGLGGDVGSYGDVARTPEQHAMWEAAQDARAWLRRHAVTASNSAWWHDDAKVIAVRNALEGVL